MERVSSALEMMDDSRDAMSTDQSSWSGKRRAKVWDYVDSEVVDGKEKAICKYCKIHLSSVPGRGNSHLNRHIGFHCQYIPQEDRDRFLATLKSKSTDGEHHVFEPVVFWHLIAKYFVRAEVTFRKADDPSWVELLNYCQPSFRVVGCQTVRSDCLLLYEEEKLQLADKIRKLKSHVSLTTDLWS